MYLEFPVYSLSFPLSQILLRNSFLAFQDIRLSRRRPWKHLVALSVSSYPDRHVPEISARSWKKRNTGDFLPRPDFLSRDNLGILYLWSGLVYREQVRTCWFSHTAPSYTVLRIWSVWFLVKHVRISQNTYVHDKHRELREAGQIFRDPKMRSFREIQKSIWFFGVENSKQWAP